jgi:hypothetical protein
MAINVDLIQLANVIDASYRQNADKAQAIVVSIDAFIFVCNPITGNAASQYNKQGGVNEMIAQRDVQPFEHIIQQALSLAAKRHLLNELKQELQPEQQNPSSISSISLFKPSPESKLMQMVNATLKAIGINPDAIKTYQDVQATLVSKQTAELKSPSNLIHK